MQPVEGQLERGSVIGGYRIDEKIGSGGMGVVYRATNVALNRIYALKVLPPALAGNEQYRERFKREMRLAASLHHPHVVGIHHAGEEDGTLFFVMDYVYGTDLRQVLQTSGALQPDRAVDLLTQITSALDAAHARGLVHRDVKPANILITVRDGEECAYLADFGVAKRSDVASDLTATGVAVGTVDYMSPEQIQGGRTDARTDVYAIGCVFFQMLTGRVPYERENSIEKLFAHVHEPPPPLEGSLTDVYPAFRPVIETAMAKDPDTRYLSAGDFSRDAAAALRGMRYSGPPTSVATGEATPIPPTDEEQPAEAPLEATSLGTELPDTEPPATEPPPPPARPSAAPPTPDPAPPAAAAAAPSAAAASQPPAPPAPPRSGLSRYRWPAAAVLALVVVGAVAAAIALSSGGGSSKPSTTAAQGQPFVSSPQPVPTNRVTATGTARLQLVGNTATVTVDTNGLLNGSAHAMHIHAGASGICPPASAARDHNGHFTINTGDGLKFYGPPQAALTTSGDTSVHSIIDFPRFPSVGNIRYSRSIQLTPELAGEVRAGNAVLVVHGIDYNGNGIYDNVLGTSDLSKRLPAEATAPALCGPLFSTQTASTGSGGPTGSGSSTYEASLVPQTPTPGDDQTIWLLCHLAGVSAD